MSPRIAVALIFGLVALAAPGPVAAEPIFSFSYTHFLHGRSVIETITTDAIDFWESRVEVDLGSRDAMHPDWSPNGTALAFTMETRSGTTAVGLLTGGEVERLTFGSEPSSQPAWSPDGSHVAFTRRHGNGQPQVFVLDVTSGAALRVSRGLAHASQPSWGELGLMVTGKEALGSCGDACEFAVYAVDPSGAEAPVRFSQPLVFPEGDDIEVRDPFVSRNQVLATTLVDGSSFGFAWYGATGAQSNFFPEGVRVYQPTFGDCGLLFTNKVPGRTRYVSGYPPGEDDEHIAVVAPSAHPTCGPVVESP